MEMGTLGHAPYHVLPELREDLRDIRADIEAGHPGLALLGRFMEVFGIVGTGVLLAFFPIGVILFGLNILANVFDSGYALYLGVPLFPIFGWIVGWARGAFARQHASEYFELARDSVAFLLDWAAAPEGEPDAHAADLAREPARQPAGESAPAASS
jgi:hypothetical protein